MHLLMFFEWISITISGIQSLKIPFLSKIYLVYNFARFLKERGT